MTTTLLFVSLLLPSLPATQDESIEVRRAEILEVASRYLNHRWKAEERHVLHGEDEDGVHVDTPDHAHMAGGFQTDGRENVGVPYQWGGFSSLEQFDTGIAEGRFAGHAPSSRGAAGSRHAVGVDCSGLVSRCWRLAHKFSTRGLPDLCYVLDDMSALRSGDVLNRSNGHVMIFLGFVDPEEEQARIVEAGLPKVVERVVDLDEMRRQGYTPLRYRPLDERWAQDSIEFAEANFEAPLGQHTAGTDSANRSWVEQKDLLFEDEVAGSWVKYDRQTQTKGSLSRHAMDLKIGLVENAETEARLHLVFSTEEGTHESSQTISRAPGAATLLALLLGMGARIEPEECRITGAPAVPRSSIPDSNGRAVQLEGHGTYHVDGRQFPIRFDALCHLTPGLPLWGMSYGQLVTHLEIGGEVSTTTSFMRLVEARAAPGRPAKTTTDLGDSQVPSLDDERRMGFMALILESSLDPRAGRSALPDRPESAR